jgi:hypothetical protein
MQGRRFIKPVMTVLLLVGFVFTLNLLVDNDTVPEGALIRTHPGIQAFLHQPSDIEGIYRNIDVDSCVFSYHTFYNADPFWNKVGNATETEGWSLKADNGDMRVYERIDKPSQGKWWGAEQVSIAFIPEVHGVVVAWVQGDAIEQIDGFSELREAEWASQVINPKFKLAVERKRTK